MMMMKWEKETWKIEWRKDGGKKRKCQEASHLPQAQFSFLPMAQWQIP